MKPLPYLTHIERLQLTWTAGGRPQLQSGQQRGRSINSRTKKELSIYHHKRAAATVEKEVAD
jgi:hypothetical protein